MGEQKMPFYTPEEAEDCGTTPAEYRPRNADTKQPERV